MTGKSKSHLVLVTIASVNMQLSAVKTDNYSKNKIF